MNQRLPYKFILISVVLTDALILGLLFVFMSHMATQAQAKGENSSQHPVYTIAANPVEMALPTLFPPSEGDPLPGAGSDTTAPGNPPAASSNSPRDAQSTFPQYWYTVLGAVFLPANSGYSYQYGNSGCIKSNSIGYWRASVNLPSKSVAKYIYIDYYNIDKANNSTAYFTKYKYNGDNKDLVSVNSRNYTTTGITGYFIDLSGEFTETIDNLQYGYSFIWSGSTTQRLCSVKLGYYPPSIFGNAMPWVTH